MRSLVRAGLLAGLAVLSSACLTLGPQYRRPEIAMPQAFPGAAPATNTAPAAIADAWWKEFQDPALDALVDEALRANQDLVAAAARVEEARALYGESRSDRFPQVTAGLSASRSKLSAQTSQLPPTADLTTSRVHASGDLSFELDFWGRLARASEAARAELVASEEGRREVRTGLIADVVTAYLDLRTFDRQLAVTRQTVDSRTEAVRLQRVRFDAGTISELDLAQAQAELAVSEAAAPDLERLVRQAEDRLAVLLGRIGGSIERSGEVAAGTLALTLPEVPAGLPSDLLTRRPDVAAAEQRLVASHARVAVARAGYFPSISLTGSLGSESRELSELFKAGTGIWSAAAGLLQPIFQAGKVTRQVEAARARERQALAAYAKTLQTAFAEVSDALAARSGGSAQRAALEREVEALGRALHLAQLRYEAGDSSYLEVLDAERALFRGQLDLAAARRSELAAAVTLFKALGGGWSAAAQTSAP